MAEEYLPVFAEEIFIVNLYGNDDEIEEFNFLMQSPDVEKNLISMALLIEEIKRRSLLKMNWYCCWRCQYHASCKINWYRGLRRFELRNCCTYCQNFWDCHRQYCNQVEGNAANSQQSHCGKPPDEPAKSDPGPQPGPPSNVPRKGPSNKK
ncbi:MAG: hypothetical protein HQM09_08990 [Candidatus Riflebacteria bacterium]|nr:hypothetical protein [Candidatus Riflebacteria bacterium]